MADDITQSLDDASAGETGSLVSDLGDDDPLRRQRAAERLSVLGVRGAGALEILRTVIRNDDVTEVRVSALRAIVAIDSDRARVGEELTGSLRDRAWEVRAEAARLLGEAGPTSASAVQQLWDRTLDEDIDVVAAAADALIKIVPNAEELLDSALAQLSVVDANRTSGATVLIDRLILDDDQRDRAGDAIWNIVCRTPDERIADIAFSSFANNRQPSEVIARLLNEPSMRDVRRGHFLLFWILREGLEDKWRTESERVTPLVLATLDDPNPDAREAALSWLLAHASDIDQPVKQSMIVKATELLQHNGQGLQLLRALIGDVAATAILLDEKQVTASLAGRALLLDSPDLLDGFEDPNIVAPRIAAALDDQDWRVRQASARWLGERAVRFRPELIEKIEELLSQHTNDPDNDVRISVEAAQVQLQERRRAVASAPWFKLLATGDADAQVEAVRHIVALGTREAVRNLVTVWSSWVALDERPVLVELVADALRSEPTAVRPFVELLESGRLSEELDANLIEEIGLDAGLAARLRTQSLSSKDGRRVEAWLEAIQAESPELGRLSTDARRRGVPRGQVAREAFERVVASKRLSCEQAVRVRVARQLADMSDDRFYGDEAGPRRDVVLAELQRQAVPTLTRALFRDESVMLREDIARTLGNVSGREAVESLARAVVGEERTRLRRQDLLSKYYLDPSKERGEEAATILRGAVKEARATLRILQILNGAVFLVGLVALAAGLTVVLFADSGSAKLAGALAGVGGFFGIALELVRNPIADIQTAMTRLVQIETAFTSFIWELNLNGTYIQSQYVARGVLTDEDISSTATRIEDAMNLAMNLVATYTQANGIAMIPRLTTLNPPSGSSGMVLTVRGEHLSGRGRQAKDHGIVAIDHIPVAVDIQSWTDRELRFPIPSSLPNETTPQTHWVSLFVNGTETNALPYTLLATGGSSESD